MDVIVSRFINHLPVTSLIFRIFILTLSLNVYGTTATTDRYNEGQEPITSNENIDTKAGPLLQDNIIKRLFYEASKFHKECNHRILKAEGYNNTERSIIISKMNEKAIELEQGLRAKNQILVERWFVKSRASMNVYEVLLIKSGEGTDIMVKKIE